MYLFILLHIYFHSNYSLSSGGSLLNIKILYSHISTFEHFEVNHKQDKSFHLHSNQSLFEVWMRQIQILCFTFSKQLFNHYSNLVHRFIMFLLMSVCSFYALDFSPQEGVGRENLSSENKLTKRILQIRYPFTI